MNLLLNYLHPTSIFSISHSSVSEHLLKIIEGLELAKTSVKLVNAFSRAYFVVGVVKRMVHSLKDAMAGVFCTIILMYEG